MLKIHPFEFLKIIRNITHLGVRMQKHGNSEAEINERTEKTTKLLYAFKD